MTTVNTEKRFDLSSEVKAFVITTVTIENDGTKTIEKHCVIKRGTGEGINIKLFELIVLRELIADIITEMKTTI